MEFSTSTSPFQPIIFNHGTVSPTDHPLTHPPIPTQRPGGAFCFVDGVRLLYLCDVKIILEAEMVV
jgi:hypothetical protein